MNEYKEYKYKYEYKYAKLKSRGQRCAGTRAWVVLVAKEW